MVSLGENKLGDGESSMCVGCELKLSETGKKQVVLTSGERAGGSSADIQNNLERKACRLYLN